MGEGVNAVQNMSKSAYQVTADFSAVCFHDSRLTATDECAHRLHFQTFSPEVRSQNREAAVYVDWC